MGVFEKNQIRRSLSAKEYEFSVGTAVMRKQLTVMRAVLISGKPYDPAFIGRVKLNGQRV